VTNPNRRRWLACAAAPVAIQAVGYQVALLAGAFDPDVVDTIHRDGGGFVVDTGIYYNYGMFGPLFDADMVARLGLTAGVVVGLLVFLAFETHYRSTQSTTSYREVVDGE